MSYTIMAYKPDSADYCMNCLMATYGSDFKLSYDIDEDAVISMWANILSTQLGCSEAGYEVHVLEHGYPISQDKYDWMERVAGELAKKLVESREEEKRKDRKKKDDEIAKSTEAAEKQLLKELSEKYAGKEA